MAHQVVWTKGVVDEFIRLGNLSEDEEKVLLLHAKGKNRVQIEIETMIPIHTVDRIIKSLKIKYDHAQMESNILKPRKKNMKELYE